MLCCCRPLPCHTTAVCRHAMLLPSLAVYATAVFGHAMNCYSLPFVQTAIPLPCNTTPLHTLNSPRRLGGLCGMAPSRTPPEGIMSPTAAHSRPQKPQPAQPPTPHQNTKT